MYDTKRIQGEFLGYACTVPDLMEVAEKLDLRLADSPEQPKSYRPSAEKMGTALRNLNSIVRNQTGPNWKTDDDVDAIGKDTPYAAPTAVIAARDLVLLLQAQGINSTIATWAVFEAIESGCLLAVIQWAKHEYKEVPYNRHQFLRSRRLQQSASELPPQAPAMVETSPAAQYVEGLLVWPKRQKRAPLPVGRRSKKAMTKKEEQQVVDAWASRQYRDYAALADSRNKGESGGDIKRVLDRVKQRKRRKN